MIYDNIIIGGGLAGLTAGLYLARKKINFVILTKEIGGQPLLTDNIENFPGFEFITGRDLIEKIKKQIEKYGGEIREDTEVESIKKEGDKFLISTKAKEKFEAKSVIIATGRLPRQLGIPGEKEFENRGVALCATCDAPLFKNKDVAVIGSGNSGLEATLDLTKYANKIYVLEMENKIMGDAVFAERLKGNSKAEFILNIEIKEIKGANFVEKVLYKEKESEAEKEINVSGVFITAGWSANAKLFESFLKLNEKGEIVINPETNETSVKGIFGAGDVTDVKFKQMIIAAGEGAKVALSVYDYLSR